MGVCVILSSTMGNDPLGFWTYHVRTSSMVMAEHSHAAGSYSTQDVRWLLEIRKGWYWHLHGTPWSFTTLWYLYQEFNHSGLGLRKVQAGSRLWDTN